MFENVSPSPAGGRHGYQRRAGGEEDVAVAGEGVCDSATALRRLAHLAALEPHYRPRPAALGVPWRSTFMDWFDVLGRTYAIDDETVAVAANYLDRFARCALTYKRDVPRRRRSVLL